MMRRFPVDAPKTKVIRTLERLGFRMVREGDHISMVRENPDGSRTPLTMPMKPDKAAQLTDFYNEHLTKYPYCYRVHGGAEAYLPGRRNRNRGQASNLVYSGWARDTHPESG